MIVPDVLYYDFDNFRLDLEKQQLLKDGEPVLLTHKAFQTLHILVQNNGQIVEKENIYNSIWGDSFVEEANLTQYIYLLRKTLDKSPSGVSYIETVPRRGYAFTAEVHTISSGKTAKPDFKNGRFRPLAGSALAPALKYVAHERLRSDFVPLRLVPNENSDAVINEPAADLPPAENRRPTLFKMAVLALVIAGACVGLFFYFSPDKPVVSTPAGVSSLAVLPFLAIDQESSNSKLGFGMANAIITRLSNLKKVQVRPTSSVFRYMDRPSVSNAAAGAELGVDALLEGTVQRDGDRVRVSVQLFHVTEGKPVWAEKFDEKYTDVFSLQDSIAARVVSTLELKLTPQQWKFLEDKPTNSPQALEAYDRGIYFWNTRTKEDLEKAEASFLRAIELDPNFARAYAMLADTYNMIGYYRFADRTETASKAAVATTKALMLDDSVAEAHIANAFIQFTPTQVDAAKISIERAIELAPYNATARLRHGWILLRLNRLDEAVAEMKLAQEYDPLSPTSNGALCNMLTYKENFAEAVTVCRRAVELAPTTADNRLALANALFFNGETDEAIAQAQIDVEQGRRKFSSLGNVGFYYAKLGRRAEAEAVLAQLRPEAEKDPGLYVDLTLIEYALGNRDNAFGYFQQAYEKKMIGRNLFHHDPVWKEVRDDPRFARMMSGD